MSTDGAGTIGQLQNILDNVPGMLRVITNEHKCQPDGSQPGDANFNPELCVGHEFNSRDPRHYVIHKATHLEGPDAQGFVRVFTDEGDWTYGEPENVMKRLLQAAQVE